MLAKILLFPEYLVKTRQKLHKETENSPRSINGEILQDMLGC
jgi:hypothetical protein